MKKRRIVLASLLKPVDDPRMLEKMGHFLEVSGGFEVHIVGYPSLSKAPANIHTHPLPRFSRMSIKRITARLRALVLVIKVKPEILIVTTHELLGVAILIRILFGARIVYDIQENYWKNIMYTNAFPAILRPVIASLVRLKEWCASLWFSHFVLAEKCYADELGFIGKRYTVIENKCLVKDDFKRMAGKDSFNCIFTGTIAESTGVFQAIELAKKLHEAEPRVTLKIIGYCAQGETLVKVKAAMSSCPFISLAGGDQPVPHAAIMDALAMAGFGIICYPLSPHVENKMPTKLFEYLACGVPILLQNHGPWVDFCTPSQACLPVDYLNPDIASIVAQMRSHQFYTHPPLGARWQDEEPRLLALLNSL